MSNCSTNVRIVEIGHDVSAPYCCKLLADLGADVIKVEQLVTGDRFREIGTFPNDTEDLSQGGLFRYLNANKRSVEFDIQGNGDVDTVLKLVAEADIVVENLGPGVLEGRGLGFDQLKATNPTIAFVRISDFGQDGPNANIPATDFTVQAASGWVSKHFSGRKDPIQVGGRAADYTAGVHAACAALTAYKTCLQLGEAVLVDVSKQECLLASLPQPALFLETLSSLGMGLPEDRVFPVPGVVLCRDGFVGINVLTAQQFSDCCNFLGVPEYIPKQMELNVIGPELDAFYKDIEPWLMDHGAEEIMELGQSFRIPACPVPDGRQLPNLAQLENRGFYRTNLDGNSTEPGFIARMEKTPLSIRRHAPHVGEHNAEVTEASWTGTRTPSNCVDKSSEDCLPFKGLRILDLGIFWAGPYVSCYLGSLGADVIKVESIQRPDPFRYSMAYPQLGDDWYEKAGGWRGTNLNKQGVTLNLDQPEGKRIFERLVAKADVIIENFSPRVIGNLGFSSERLRELNPSLIILRMPGFGLEGPWQDYVGWAMSLEQASGIAWITGGPVDKPLQAGILDPIVGMHAAVVVQAALEYRNRTGEAQLIEMPQMEVAACMTAEQVIAYSLTGKVQQRIGNRSETMAPQGVYQCADKEWIAISVRDDADWQQFVTTMGSPKWATDDRFIQVRNRQQHHDELDQLISGWSKNLKTDETIDALRSAGIPVAKILTAPKMYNEPHLVARDFYEPVEHPRYGITHFPRWPMRQSPGPKTAYRSSAPTLGQHNREILHDELNMENSEIDELANKEIIGTIPKGL